MPRYFFHVKDRFGDSPDQIGRELPSLAVAKQKAILGLRSLIAADVAEGILDLSGTMEVANSAGDCLLRIGFGSAVQPPRGTGHILSFRLP